MKDTTIYATPTQFALSVNLDILAERLASAAKIAELARDQMNRGEQGEAIMMLWRLEKDLLNALALYNVSNVLDCITR